MRLLCFGGLQVVVCLFAANARAADPQLATEIRTSASHAELSRRACALGIAARVADVVRPIEVHALEDGVTLCSTETSDPDALSVTIRMLTRADPFRIALAIDAPADASTAVLADYEAALRVARDALDRIALDTLPDPPPPSPPSFAAAVPRKKMTSLVTAGEWMMGLASVPTTIVGIAIAAGSSVYPGTSQVWPFVPFFGMTVFSATYTEVAGCNCPEHRPMSILLSSIVNGAQIAGLVFVLVGSTSSKKTLAARVFMTPGGIGGTF